MRALKHFFTAAFAAFMLLALPACGAIPGNTQVNAGITHAQVEMGIADTDAGQVIYVKNAEIVDGKDKQAVGLNITAPGGWTVAYTASGVSGLDAIKVRGAVEEAISSDLKEAAPGIVQGVVDAILKAYVP